MVYINGASSLLRPGTGVNWLALFFKMQLDRMEILNI